MRKVFKYTPVGVCATSMTFALEDNVIVDYDCQGGCPGNRIGIKKLIIGMDIDTVIEKLSGIDCRGGGNSCPNQIAVALKNMKCEGAGVKLPDEIKLFNRYGDKVVLESTDTERLYKLKNEAAGGLRVGFQDSERQDIAFVDPSGGPMINATFGNTTGSRFENLCDIKKYPDLAGYWVSKIYMEADGVFVTITNK